MNDENTKEESQGFSALALELWKTANMFLDEAAEIEAKLDSHEHEILAERLLEVRARAAAFKDAYSMVMRLAREASGLGNASGQRCEE